MNDKPISWRDHWTLVIVVNMIFLGLEFMVYRALAPVERGEQASTAVIHFIADIYKTFGYRAAISVFPTLQVLMNGIMAWETWKRVKADRAKRTAQNDG